LFIKKFILDYPIEDKKLASEACRTREIIVRRAGNLPQSGRLPGFNNNSD
jgi:hypothetical protein